LSLLDDCDWPRTAFVMELAEDLRAEGYTVAGGK
jgi:hypothetical protein